MKVEVTETGPCRRRVAIEIEPEVVEDRIAEQVRKYRRTRSIPGFRQGRATESLIRARFGKQIRASVLQDLIPEMWNQAMEEQKLEPVDRPALDKLEGEPGHPLRIAGEVEVKPAIEVKDYKGIRATREIRKITDEDVERQIEHLREERADEAPVDRPAQSGDVLVATVQTLDPTGVPIIGRRDENRRWQLGGLGSVSADMDEQLVGIAKGETRAFLFHYREDFFDAARAGKEDRASVTVQEVYERQVPPLNDEFAKDLGDFATTEDLRKAIREDLERQARQFARAGVHEQLRDRVVQRNQFDVPESLVERLLDGLFRDHERQGHEHDREEFFSEHRVEATNRVRGVLALERIAKQESIAVSNEQVDEGIAQMAARMRMTADELRRAMAKSARYESLRSEMLDDAVLAFLEEQADIEEVEIDGGSKIIRS